MTIKQHPESRHAHAIQAYQAIRDLADARAQLDKLRADEGPRYEAQLDAVARAETERAHYGDYPDTHNPFWNAADNPFGNTPRRPEWYENDPVDA